MRRKEYRYLSPPLRMQNNYDEILVVHLGGLGDMCLAESVFLSCFRHFGNCLAGLGNRRFLDLFSKYFARTYGVESRHWLYLFSEKLTGPVWRRIIFIGKDRQGALRERWGSYSHEKLIFIDMYPEGSFPDPEKDTSLLPRKKVHVEEYQLRQLGSLGIEPVKAVVIPKKPGRVILYPEKGFTKGKWVPENFIVLGDLLERNDISRMFLKPAGLDLPGEGVVIHELMEVKRLFAEGGIFVSNDSGMAHFAGTCGLQTITVFTDFDPAIWHPRGENISLRLNVDNVSVEAVGNMVRGLLERQG